jgi:hypothetical protein
MKKDLADTPSLETVANLMTRVGLLDAEIRGGKRDAEYFANIETVALGLFRIVVVGEIKKGKSSFINALCGTRDLVPVHDNVATSTIFKIHYGVHSEYKVYFQPEAGRKKRTISADQLKQYGTEDGNPNNGEKVDFIAVQSPSQLLKEGFILIDTPGVGGLFKNHRKITFKYAPKADAVFFVTDSVESPIGADEVSFLKELRNITKLIYFVQTKGADADPESRKRRMENNISILTDQAGFSKEEIRYFVVDSNLKLAADETKNMEDLQDSGFIPLMAYLNNDLKPARVYNIANVGFRRCYNKFIEIRACVQQQRSILDAETVEKQQAILEELNSAESSINDWNSNIRPQLVREFQVQVQAIQNDINTVVSDKFRQGGELSEAAGRTLAGYATKGPEIIYKSAQPLAEEVRAKASEVLLQISNDLETRMTALLEALARKIDGSINLSNEFVGRSRMETKQIHYGETQLRELVKKGEDQRHFEKVRTFVYGGMAGVTIASIAGGIVGSVVPVVGTMIGSTIGMLIAGAWGGKEATSIVRSKEAAAARQSVHAFIEKDLSSIHVQVQDGFNKAFTSLRFQADEALAAKIKNFMSQLAADRNLLMQRGKASADEIAKEKQRIVILESQIASLDRELKAMDKRLY